MIASKHITKVIAALMAVLVCLCLCAIVFSDTLTGVSGGTGVSMEYETELFDTSQVMTVNILIDEDDWADLLTNAASEEYSQCDVEINGTTFYSVGLRPKGNTSLSSVVSDPDSDRYSLKIEFDQYVEGQLCFGLDKLVLNNNYSDATNMKEALVYDMYQYLNTDAPLYNYAEISVNGEYWGLYLALESVEDSFLLRNYGVSSGELYKPDSMEMGGGGAGGKPGGGDMPAMGNMAAGRGQRQLDNNTVSDTIAPEADGETSTPSTSDRLPDFSTDPNMRDETTMESPGRGGNRGGSRSGSGANLNYTDDELDNYSTIWEGEVFNTSDADHTRVVTALKNIASGTDLEIYMDVDNLLRYMAVHTFAVNADSLSGNMAHNYYLYEYNGQLNILPWDYNLSLGGMNGGDASDVINDAIDSPFSGTQFFDTLLADEDYLAQYHAYLNELVEEYIFGGAFDAFYERVRSQIDGLVETDPDGFYTYDEYVDAAETFYQVVKLRGESIRGQLDGTIPSTDEGQRTDSSTLIVASGIDLSTMGTMMGGRSSDRNNRMGARNDVGSETTDDGAASEVTGIDSTEESDLLTENTPQTSQGEFASDEGQNQGGRSRENSFGNRTGENGDSLPAGGFPGGNSAGEVTDDMEASMKLYAICLLVLAAGLVFAKFYRKR